MKSGVGRNSGGSSQMPVSLAPTPWCPQNSCSSESFRTSAFDTVTASSSAGTRLPISVEGRKYSTVCLHLSSTSWSLTFYRSFHIRVTFLSSAHMIFCCGFHSGYSLKWWSPGRRLLVTKVQMQKTGIPPWSVHLQHLCISQPLPRSIASNAKPIKFFKDDHR